MSLAIRLHPDVVTDLVQVADWYNGQRPGLGDEFISTAYEAFDLLAGRPGSFPTANKKGIRRGLMRRFPYAIYFRVEAEAVTILVVIHTARSPRVWKRRL